MDKLDRFFEGIGPVIIAWIVMLTISVAFRTMIIAIVLAMVGGVPDHAATMIVMIAVTLAIVSQFIF